MRYDVGFWTVAFAFMVSMAFAAVPAPLYPLYQARDGFSTFMITIIFASYAAGVVTSLMLAGHISDWVGRKKILIPALLLELVATVLFLTMPSLGGLIAARFISGLGIGMLTATATAHLHDLHVRHRPSGASTQRFEIVSTAANVGGIGFGPLIGGLLAQFVIAPLHTPYIVFGILILASVVAVAFVPETVETQFSRPAYRPQGVSANHGNRAGYVAALSAGFIAFAVFGVFTSVAPSFVAGALGQPSRAVAGIVVFVVFGSAALAQTTTGRLSIHARQAIGLVAMAIGLVVLVIGMFVTSFTVFLIGGVFTGVGAGLLFKAAVGAVAKMASSEKRGQALAGLFLIAYIGMSLPAVGIGLATLVLSPAVAMAWLTAVLLVVLSCAAVLARRGARNQPTTIQLSNR